MSLVIIMALCPAATKAGSVIQLDPYGGTRKIPDMTGSPGDSITLQPESIIDILILGDGYMAGDSADFVAHSRWFYNQTYGSGPTPGIRPFSSFAPAFRVRCIWQPSIARADSDLRESYYRVKTTEDLKSVAGEGWFNGGTEPDDGFNDTLFQTIDALDPKNDSQYPLDLINSVNGHNVLFPLAGVYRNLYVFFWVATDSGWFNTPSGLSGLVTEVHGDRKVKVAFMSARHEFCHAFSYIRDEYIHERVSSHYFSNPHPDSVSVFNMTNLTFTDDRCDLPWKHLAPGGKYNPINVFSVIGNLFVGGDRREKYVWHSEYKCLINGQLNHFNYECWFSDPEVADLRDGDCLCFWCEEVTAVRILERARQFVRVSDSVDINSKGRQWFRLWEDSLRDGYYNYFNIDSLIAHKDSCYALWAGGSCASCSTSCDLTPIPECLIDCDIREVGNAIYVDAASGADGNPGTKSSPKGSIVAAVSAACTPGRLVMLKGGEVTYPTPVGLIVTEPAILIPEGCSSVIIGK